MDGVHGGPHHSRARVALVPCQEWCGHQRRNLPLLVSDELSSVVSSLVISHHLDRIGHGVGVQSLPLWLIHATHTSSISSCTSIAWLSSHAWLRGHTHSWLRRHTHSWLRRHTHSWLWRHAH